MKRVKSGNEFSERLNLPKDLPWKVFGKLLTDLGFTPRNAPKVFGAIRNRDPYGLQSAAAASEPRSMLGSIGATKDRSYRFYRHYQLSAFLKKFPFSGVDTTAPALATFEAAEEECRLFNNYNYRSIEVLSESHPSYLGILDEIRSDIKELIGDVPNLNGVFEHAKHGPGVSLGDQYRGGKCTSYFKWSNLPYTVTEDALPYAKAAIASDPRWIGALDNWYRKQYAISITAPLDLSSFWGAVFKVVDGSKITTVPKSAFTDRTIAIEPLLNCYLQLGVDWELKRVLKRKWAYDLRTQLKNQEYAKQASIDNKMSTIDLSAASDSISLKVCEMLLPPQWYDLLLNLRSPKGVFRDKEYTFEKISSMGNGYTFALEALIFGALARCSIRRTKSERKSAVYGDDIIVPSTATRHLYDLLNLFGFKVNKDKSFVDGPFRESCGADFFLGYDVRPLFLTRTLKTVPDLFYLHNSLVLLEQQLSWTWDVDFSATRAYLRSFLPIFVKRNFYGPLSESLDTHLFSERRLKRNAYGERVYWAVIPVAQKDKSPSDFFFRKLMWQQASHPRSWEEKHKRPLTLFQKQMEARFNWQQRSKSSSGNAFDIVKRGYVQLRCTKVRLP